MTNFERAVRESSSSMIAIVYTQYIENILQIARSVYRFTATPFLEETRVYYSSASTGNRGIWLTSNGEGAGVSKNI